MRSKNSFILIQAVLLCAGLLFPATFSFGKQAPTPNSLSSEMYFLHSPEEHSRRLARFLKNNAALTEEEKIRYLLNAMGTSKVTFIRNGLAYKSGRAVSWLRYKMLLARKRRNPILTAQDFVEKIARRSEASGKPYELVLTGGTRVAAYDVFRCELESLEKACLGAYPSKPGTLPSIS